MNDPGWVQISPKKKYSFGRTSETKISERKAIHSYLRSILSDWGFISVAIYGSCSSDKGHLSPLSDIDIMVFCKEKPILDDLRALKVQIVNHLQRKIDIVIMHITKKFQNPIFHNKCFYDQVWETGNTLMGDDFKDYLDKSIKIKKI